MSCRMSLQAAGRLRKNANYFRVNYLIIMLMTTAATFLMHPSSLLVLGLLASGWMYVFLMRTTPIVVGGRTLRCAWLHSAELAPRMWT